MAGTSIDRPNISAAAPGFKEWICSFSGCDGGNENWPIWICGIESGFAGNREWDEATYKREINDYYSKKLPAEMALGKYSPPRKSSFSEHLQYQYVLKAAKLCTVIHGAELEQVREYAKELLVFRLNLSPIALRNTDESLWEQHHLDRVTGLATRELFRAWCFLHRYPWIAGQVREHRPKLVIGTGTGYLTDFLCAFGDGGAIDSIHREDIAAGDTSRPLYWTKVNNATTIAVTPFLGGATGLNSDELIKAFGRRLANLMNA